MANEFRIQIYIDGKKAEAQAKALQTRIGKALTGGVDIDLSGLEKVAKAGGTKGISLTGAVDITGLAETSEQLMWLRAETDQPFIFTGRIDVEGLAAAREQMGGIRQDAGAIGRAIGAGLSGQWENLQGKLEVLQSQITGIVRAGEASKVAPDMLEAMPELEAALSSGEKKALDLTLKMGDLNARIKQLNESFAELSRVKVRPLAGGDVRTVGELFKGIAEPYHRGKIKKIVQGIDRELAPLEQRVQEAVDGATDAAARGGEGLRKEIADIEAYLEKMELEKPPISPALGAITEEQVKWQEDFDALVQERQRLLTEANSLFEQEMAKGGRALQEELGRRRRELMKPLEEEYTFWEEWSTASVEEISHALRSTGQSAAAESLQEMQAVFDERKRLQTQLKRAFGGMVKGGEVEMPKGAKGTLVDFISAERALTTQADQAAEALTRQAEAVKKLIKLLDTAALSAQGYGKTQRYALERMEMVGRREMVAATKKGVPLEEAGEAVSSIMAELTTQAYQMRQEMAKAFESAEAEEATKKTATGVVRVWEWVRDVLVGRSIIPDMVQDIERWLATIGQESPFTSVVTDAEGAAEQVLQSFAQLSTALPAEEVAMQVSLLESEIRSLESEFGRMMVKGTEASNRYQQEFQETADLVRQVLGTGPEVESKLAQGMLPKGFKVGAGESVWQRGAGRETYGGLEREGDVWYKALNLEVQEVGRQNTEAMDRLAEQIVAKQAQLAALQQGQLTAMAEGYDKALAGAEAMPPGEADQLVAEMSQTFDALGAAQATLADSIVAVNEQAAIESEKQAAVIQAEARAFARSSVGKAAAASAKAESEERIAQARAEAEVVKQEARAAGKERQQAAMRETVLLRSQVKERQRLQRLQDQQAKAQERANRQTASARQLAAELGIEWEEYIQAAIDAGTPLEEIVGILRRIQREQRGVNRQAEEYRRGQEQTGSAFARFGKNLSEVRMQAQGTHQVLGDLGNVSRSLQFASTALTGSLTLAGREYIELARQTDVASRSLMLNAELTESMRRQVVQMSADLALVDPQTTAEGVTIWAQATGQQIEAQDDLNALLEQTIPLQQLASLSQENLGQITDGTAASLRQFNLDISETDRVVAIFSKVADDTLASVGDMSEAFKFVGPQAAEMGESIEEVAALVGILGDSNIRGSTAGRAYRQMLISIVEPSAKAKEALETTFGDPQPFYDAQGTFVGMTQVIDMLAAATENATDQERELLLSTLFTSNALPGVTALVNEQTEARSAGINAIRAQAKLLEGTIDAEVQAYGRLKQEADGVSITMMGAMDVWEQQLDDWEESDVYRVQQMEMRWKGFWLSIGESAVNFALPYIDRASESLREVTALIEGQPALGALVAVGAGGLAVATLMRVTLSTVRTVQNLRAIAIALERTTQQQVTTGSRFQTQVVTAAEQFSRIITASAAEAAATEEAGAVAEVATEEAGAVSEAGIENAGATAEAGIEAAGAVAEAGIEAAGAVAESTIEVTSLLALPAMLALAVVDALSKTELGERMGLQSAGKYVSVAAYGVGKMIGGEEMGQEWFMRTAGAMGELDEEAQGLGSSLDAVGFDVGELADYHLRHLEEMARSSGSQVGALVGDLYQLNEGLADAVKFTEAEERAIDLYVEMLRKQEEALDQLNAALADALADLNADLASMEAEFWDEVDSIREEARESEIEHERKFQEQQAKNHEAHLKRMARMEEDHLLKMADLARTRDAYGMLKEKQRYELARSRAEEDYTDQANQRAQEFARQQQERRRQAEERIAEMRLEHEREKAERIAAYEARREELLAEHEESMARLEKEYFDKINAELQYYKMSQEQQNAWMSAMLADAQTWLSHKRDLWLDYVQNLPTPQYGAGAGGGGRGGAGLSGAYQRGGYTVGGLAMVHDDEYILNPATTKAAEAALGPLTQAKLIDGLAGGAGRGGTFIRAELRLLQDFTFQGPISVADRQWIRKTARSEAEVAFQEALRGVAAMGG